MLKKHKFIVMNIQVMYSTVGTHLNRNVPVWEVVMTKFTEERKHDTYYWKIGGGY